MKARFLFVIALVCQLFTQAQIITTVAGVGTAQPGDGGPATDCKLNEPIGVAVDAAGNIYIAERAKHCIRKIDPSGTITTVAGAWGVAGYSGDGGPATAARLNEPYGIILDEVGNIYFSEQLNNCIRKINIAGIISTIAGNGTVGYSGDGGPATNAQFAGAGFIALDGAGNIYVPDFGNHCIRKVSTTGIVTTVAGGNGPGYSGDGGIATDAKMNRPKGIVTDALGNLYVAEYGSNRIRKITTSGVISTIAGTGTAGYNGEDIDATSAQLKGPLSLAIDNTNSLYISEPDNYRIRKISASGKITTIAGTGINGSSGDGGPATNATFQTLTGLCLNSSGALFLNDIGSDKVRRIAGVVGVETHVKSECQTIEVFPVPNNGIFSVQTPLAISFVNVYNIGGVLVHEQTCIGTETQVDITAQPPGAYIVYVRCGDKMYVSKVVKN
jgi:hypothetical protein